MPVRNRFAQLKNEIQAWRRDLHEHPELNFDTIRTAGIVKERLHEFGCDLVETGIGRTGVVGLIHGRQRSSSRTVGLRADMDALPIKENTGLPYASRHEGKMHACGHDGHTAMLLGAARYLCETRNFNGTVAVVFQPAEEGGGGGLEMVKDGMMDRFGIDEIYGMHNMPGMDIDAFAIRPGPFFASADIFRIDVSGVGGHAAQPHLGTDTTLVGCHIVVALQTIISRVVNPRTPAVLSVTSFETDTTAYNVIPQSLRLKGTVRVLDADARKLIARKLDSVATGIADAFGASAKVTFTKGYPVMVNSETETEYAAQAARRVSPKVDDTAELIMGAEDFSFMLNERPGAYILVGNGDTARVHNPNYDFNDDAIPYGCSWWVEVAENRLPLAG
ncbi:MAG: M20 family metallopeptidase [Rhodobacteraceae bacterium]|nr:M20 family metallopeptidase [Paracoccaceae bacterium]